MNIKRAIGFGVITWVLIFVVYSILLFTPQLADREIVRQIVFWVILIPIVLGSAKWYFRSGELSWYRGLSLGVIGLIVGTLLDISITIPFFSSNTVPEGVSAFRLFYSNQFLYIGYIWYILLAVYAGFEFDATFTDRKNGE
jgi:hypothetical protein